MEEIEAKFLDIDPNEIQQKLKLAGATRLFDRMYRRRVFDYPDLRLDKIGAWLRLRDEGDKVTLAFKQRIGVKSYDNISKNDDGMEEVEITVSDFDKTAELIKAVGLVEKFYEENRRIRYMLGGVEVDIDFWPQLEPYLEIEGPSWEEVDGAASKLGLNPADKKIVVVYQLYKMTGIEEKDYSEITFRGMIKKTA